MADGLNNYGIVNGRGHIEDQTYAIDTAISTGGYLLYPTTTADTFTLAASNTAGIVACGIASYGTISIHTGVAAADVDISVSPLVSGATAYLILADANVAITIGDEISMTNDADNDGTVDKLTSTYQLIGYAMEAKAANFGDTGGATPSAATIAVKRNTIKVRLA